MNLIKHLVERSAILVILIVFSSWSEPGENKLTIEIRDLKNSKGKVLLELSDTEKNVIKGVSAEIVNNICTITINDLEDGRYSFRYFHDENNNEELDTNFIGIPKEGFGFSNNAKGTFGPPAFEKTIFEIKGSLTLKCVPSYF